MKFFKAFTSGAIRALRSIKAILLFWLMTFAVLAVFTYPLKSFINEAMGNSMITNLLDEGFNLTLFTDLGQAFSPMMSYITSGFLILLLLYFFLYNFLNGGLFDSLKANKLSYKPGDFFRSSARLFLSYLVVMVLVILMILLAMVLVVGVPVLIQRAGGSATEEQTWKLVSVLRIVALLVLPVFLLVADYSRTWLAANDYRKVFKSIGYGFKATFKTFFSSYFFMLIMIIVQGLFVMLVAKVLASYKPDTGGGLFLLFLLSQFLFIVKLFLRAVRYGGVTTLYRL